MKDDQSNIICLQQSIKYNEVVSGNVHVLPYSIPNGQLTRRVASMLIDLGAIGVLFASLHASYGVFVQQFLGFIPLQAQVKLAHGNFFVTASTYLLIYCSYFFYFSYLYRGQTLGKRLMNLVVVPESNLFNSNTTLSELSFKQAVQRTFGYLVCYLSFGTFYFFNFASEDKRGLSDYLSYSRTVCQEWYSNYLEHKSSSAEIIQIDVKQLDRAA